MKGKILGTGLLLLCFGLLASSVSAVETPVEVERLKDVCYVRVRGTPILPPWVTDPIKNPSGFVLHYKNLMVAEKSQRVEVQWWTTYGGGSKVFYVLPGWGEDVFLRDYPVGCTMDFEINVTYAGVPLAIISGSVVIPPA